MSDDRILTVDEAATLAQVSIETIRRWIMATHPEPRLEAFSPGKLSRSRKGRKDYRIRESVLWAYFAARETALSEAHAQAEWQPLPKPIRPPARAGQGICTLPSLKEIREAKK